MKLPGRYLLGLSMFYDASIWCLQLLRFQTNLGTLHLAIDKQCAWWRWSTERGEAAGGSCHSTETAQVPCWIFPFPIYLIYCCIKTVLGLGFRQWHFMILGQDWAQWGGFFTLGLLSWLHSGSKVKMDGLDRLVALLPFNDPSLQQGGYSSKSRKHKRSIHFGPGPEP